MDNKLHSFTDSGACPDHQTLVRYARGLSSPEELRRVEMHLADCPFCSDAIEGMMMLDNETDLTADIASLNSRINKASTTGTGRIVPFRSYLRFAASLVFLFVSISALYYFLRSDQKAESEIALAKNVKAMDTIIPSIGPAAEESDQQVAASNKNVVTNNTVQMSPVFAEKKSITTQSENSGLGNAPSSALDQPGSNTRSDAYKTSTGATRDIVDARNLAEPIQSKPGEKFQSVPRPPTETVKKDQDFEAREIDEVAEHMKSSAPSVQETSTGSTRVASVASADDKVKAKSKAPKEESAVTIPNESTSTQLSALSTKPGPFEEAVKLYGEKKYNRALAIFQSIIKKDSLSSTEAQWYSSLIYLKTNKPEKAKQILERLSSERNSRKESADSLLKILR
ncbi:MAG: hypothetical protein IPO49_06685 [Bacteroidetes bacterium]|nr:hypothetical protein [Bacteroidota bacterium]